MVDPLRGRCGLSFWCTRSSFLRFQPCLRFRPSHQDAPSPSLSRRASPVLFSASGSIICSWSRFRLPFSETLLPPSKHVIGGSGSDICVCVRVVFVCVWGNGNDSVFRIYSRRKPRRMCIECTREFSALPRSTFACVPLRCSYRRGFVYAAPLSCSILLLCLWSRSSSAPLSLSLYLVPSPHESVSRRRLSVSYVLLFSPRRFTPILYPPSVDTHVHTFTFSSFISGVFRLPPIPEPLPSYSFFDRSPTRLKLPLLSPAPHSLVARSSLA